MKSRHYGLENAKGVDNILTVPSTDQVVRCIGRVYRAWMRLKYISASYNIRTRRTSTENAPSH
jgi:hypothetical protein